LQHGEVLSALTGTSRTGVHVLEGGERVMYVAVPALRGKTAAGAVMLVVGLEDIYAALGQVRRQMVVVSLASGLLAVLFSLFLAELLTRPLKELIGAVRQVACGYLEQRIPVRSRDELGRLAAVFNEELQQ